MIRLQKKVDSLVHMPPSNNLNTISGDGVAANAKQIASPNYDDRPGDCRIDMIVIHNISLPPEEYGGNGIIELFTNELDPNEHPLLCRNSYR